MLSVVDLDVCCCLCCLYLVCGIEVYCYGVYGSVLFVDCVGFGLYYGCFFVLCLFVIFLGVVSLVMCFVICYCNVVVLDRFIFDRRVYELLVGFFIIRCELVRNLLFFVMNCVKGEEGEGIIVGGLYFFFFDEEVFYGFLVWF